MSIERGRILLGLNIAIAVGIAVAFDSSKRLDFYGWFLKTSSDSGRPEKAAFGLAFGLPLFTVLTWLAVKRQHEVVAVSTVFACVVLVWTAIGATVDASNYRLHNCVIVGGKVAGTSTWRCTFGSQPLTYVGGGSPYICEEVPAIYTGNPSTLWRCSG